MIKARASGSKVSLYFMKKGRQARHRIPRNSCYIFWLAACYSIYTSLYFFSHESRLFSNLFHDAFSSISKVVSYKKVSQRNICNSLTFIFNNNQCDLTLVLYNRSVYYFFFYFFFQNDGSFHIFSLVTAIFALYTYRRKRVENLSGTRNKKSCVAVQKPSNRQSLDPHLVFLYHISPWPHFYRNGIFLILIL